MLVIDDIRFAMAGRPLFEGASAAIPGGHKVGLVGRNGTGKTTLFRLIRGELPLEGGEIRLPSRARIGGVAQEVPASATSLLDTVLLADTERAGLWPRPRRPATPTASPRSRRGWPTSTPGRRGAGVGDPQGSGLHRRGAADALLRLLGRLADAGRAGGRALRAARPPAARRAHELPRPRRRALAESYLARYPHTVLIISHDRGLLNRAVGAILHLEDRKLTLYQGAYDTFAATRAARLAVQAAEAKKQDARRAHLQSFVDRFRAKASKATQAQSRLKMLEKLTPITGPQEAALRAFTFPEPEELSPPIVNLDSASVGYNGAPVLGKLNLRIDQDDRIALLGRNGEGKSTLSKLLAGKLPAMGGRVTRSSKLRIGYFAQHQLDELHADETPLDHVRRLRPTEAPAKLRARLAGFGLGADQADTLTAKLSGGQKARLSLLLATIDAPHLLILDEPTNHLDMESREALVEALTAYSGAVILVSHDMHLLSLVADRLWLVKGGRVAPYEQDLDAYRRELLSEPEPKTPAPEKPRRPSKEALQTLRSEVRTCEARLQKLEEMRDKLAKKLADPAMYEDDRVGEAEVWQRKYAEVMEALDRAEALWMAAAQKLEAAEA
jgi:ATP-binding cassette, subfamily F, member 3